MTALASLPLLEDGDDEPLPGCVVLDSDGDAWQRDERGWWIAAGTPSPLTFEELTRMWAPLRLLWEPDDEPVEPQ